MFRDLFTGVLAVIGAATFSQAPEFMQQYLQRLGGHLDEASRLQIQYPALAERVDALRLSHDSLATAGVAVKPALFIRHLQPDVAWNALGTFQPAVPLSVEGLIYAGFGLLAGVGLAALLRLPFRRRDGANRWRERRERV